MATVSKDIKERYWKKKYDAAPEIKCACGCGQTIKSVDLYGRPKRFLVGHNTRKYPHDDKYAYKKAWIKRNRDWANSRRKRVSHDRKISFIQQLGGECGICGVKYNDKNGATFDFHHEGRNEKSFSISSEHTNKSLEALTKEIDKCILLCANCHRIYHLGEY